MRPIRWGRPATQGDRGTISRWPCSKVRQRSPETARNTLPTRSGGKPPRADQRTRPGQVIPAATDPRFLYRVVTLPHSSTDIIVRLSPPDCAMKNQTGSQRPQSKTEIRRWSTWFTFSPCTTTAEKGVVDSMRPRVLSRYCERYPSNLYCRTACGSGVVERTTGAGFLGGCRILSSPITPAPTQITVGMSSGKTWYLTATIKRTNASTSNPAGANSRQE